MTPTQPPVTPRRIDFTTWERATLEKFAREAADENLALRHDLQLALAAWRAAVKGAHCV